MRGQVEFVFSRSREKQMPRTEKHCGIFGEVIEVMVIGTICLLLRLAMVAAGSVARAKAAMLSL